MIEKRNTYLGISAAVLLFVAIALFLMSWEENPPEIDPDYFGMTDTEQVDKLVLQSPYDTVVLTFEGSRWRVNGRWDADVQMIKVLMATLRQAIPYRMVSTSLMDTVVQQLEQRGTRVLIEEGGVVRMVFLAGGNSQKTESWFLKMGDTRPFVMVIPGYRVYVSGILQMDEGGWRDKRIFNFNWRNFKSLTASYPNEPAAGFTVEMKQRYFGIKDLTEVDTTKLNDYLDAVSLLAANHFVAGGSRAVDSVMIIAPLARIEIHDVASRTYSLDVFAGTKNEMAYYGRMEDGQIVVLDRRAIDEVAKRRIYFIP